MTLILLVTLAAEILTILSGVVSIALPHRRIWPPAQSHAWGQYYMLALFVLSGAGVILVGVLDWGSFIFPAWIRISLGIPLALIGNGLALWAIVTLGVASTSGGEGALVIRGPYRFSRNPQYLGFILGFVGWALISNSAMVWVLTLAGILPLLLVPLAEEPWLQEKLGEAYVDYMRTVPRFLIIK